MPTEASTLCRLRRHAPVGACLWIAPADAGYEGLLSLRQGNHRILGRGFSHPAGSTRSNGTKFVNVGQVMEDDNVKVTSVVVQHPPVTAALGYRFDFTDRSIAFSGDTTALEAVAKMAKGADVLVHEAIDFPAMEAFVRRAIAAGAPGTMEVTMAHMRADHTSPEDRSRKRLA